MWLRRGNWGEGGGDDHRSVVVSDLATMSYFLPRSRTARVTAGTAESTAWPAHVALEVQLAPQDLFGTATSDDKRSVLKKGGPGRVYFDNNTGEFWLQSSSRLSLNKVARDVQGGLHCSVEGNNLRIAFTAESWKEVRDVAQLAEHYILSYLTVTTGVYVRPVRISAVVSGTTTVHYELSRPKFLFRVVDTQSVEKSIQRALEYADLWCPSAPRLVLGCLYFQQAARLSSSLETKVPGLNISEIALNIAKSIEILFGDREKVREGCRQLGFSRDEIESQLVPILLIRNKLDVAHPVGKRMPADLVMALQDYVDRALENTRMLLLRVADAVAKGEIELKPFNEVAERDEKQKLAEEVSRYLNAPALRSDF